MAKKSTKKSTPVVFSATDVALEKRNLIEASAGTGKTYSVAILVLRLIIEKNISVKEILMVTFTKAAVAELEERIRLFVKSAFKCAKAEVISDTTIEAIVKRNIKDLGKEVVLKRLNDAVLNLDETSVLTIHSFCQNSLSEFAFETNQLFNAEAINDLSEIVEDQVNEFWRTYITTIEVQLLAKVLGLVSRNEITKIINNVLGGKQFLSNVDSIDDLLTNRARQIEIAEAIDESSEAAAAYKEEFINFVEENRELLRERTATNNHAVASFMTAIDDAEEFLKVLKSKYNTKYVKDLYPELVVIYDRLIPLISNIETLENVVKYSIYTLAIPIITNAISKYKKDQNIITFDDMITHLYTAVTSKVNVELYKALQAKYKAVFVDEFQDTDKLQYEIFDTIFKANTLLFFIGDPKQSIYSFRKADIFTYFKAGGKVDNKYSMDTNFRSSERYIDAMNVFFKPTPDFDTFLFGASANTIDYINVTSPSANKKGELCYNKKPVAPIEISESDNADTIIWKLAATVANLLSDKKFEIISGKQSRKIVAADIGILVRTNKQARAVKAELTRLGIHAITIDDSKLLESAEALDMLFLLQAIKDNSRANISKALLSGFTAYTRYEILNLSEEELLDKFRAYKQKWESEGAYASLNLFLKEFNVKSYLMNLPQGGDRKLANVLQLVELLHKVQQQKKYNPAELVHWFNSSIEFSSSAENEFIQRMESDEEAVKIVTIHKSKGLEYNIVFAPNLDFVFNTRFEDGSFRDTTSEIYYYGHTAQFTADQSAMQRLQMAQEDRRLLYVAITRAVYKCFVFRNNYYKTSSLSPFVNELKKYKGNLIVFQTSSIDEADEIPRATWAPFTPLTIDKLSLADTNWRKISYSAIVAEHEYHPKENSNSCTEEYDQFIFKTLPKGALCGNMLHFIFEHITFNEPASYDLVIKKALRNYFPSKAAAYKDNLLQLVNETLNAKIDITGTSINLAAVGNKQKLNELEFDFHIDEFNLKQLSALSSNERKFEVKNLGEIKGWLNGKIDLFFENEGKYYILDWKSNFLGDTLDYYSQEHLANAMNENNYHLQYLIYSLAVKKYLSKRIPNFEYNKHFGGVVYLFLRGTRKGDDKGVYVYRPEENEIDGLEKLVGG
jgi:exodeoxyribonuclease V beta subunit